MRHWLERFRINHERPRPGRILLGQRSLPTAVHVTQGIVQKLTAELTHTVHVDTMRFGHAKILGKESVEFLAREFTRLPFESSRIHNPAPRRKLKRLLAGRKSVQSVHKSKRRAQEAEGLTAAFSLTQCLGEPV